MEFPNPQTPWLLPIFQARGTLTDALEEAGAIGFPPSGILYHYTNANGLKGIVEANSLWATAISYMNDSQELSYGLDLVKQVVLEKLEQEDLNPKLKSLLSGLIRHIERPASEYIFVCCFTSEKDQLSQWRGYAGSAVGYSIGFGEFEFDDSIRTYYVRVIYDEATQIEIINKFLDSLTVSFLELNVSEEQEGFEMLLVNQWC